MSDAIKKSIDCRRCPVCGFEFDPVSEINKCGVCGNESARDELIGEDADYAWVE